MTNNGLATMINTEVQKIAQERVARSDLLLTLTANVAVAFMAKGTVAKSEIPEVLDRIHTTLSRLAAGNATIAVAPQPAPQPAVPVRKSIQDDFIICLEDGKKFKSLKRHISAHYGLTPEEYRTKWGLPADYPMVAPNYAAARSQLAKKMGLGKKPRARAH